MPGIPKKPTVNAVTGFIATVTPINLPNRFNSHRAAPPIRAFIIHRSKNLKGTNSNQPTKYKSTNPIMYASIMSNGIFKPSAVAITAFNI